MENVSLFQIVSAALAVILLVDISVLWLTGRQVPDLLGELVVGVFISYFASATRRPRGGATTPAADGGAPGGMGGSQP